MITSPLDPYASAIQLWLNEGASNNRIVTLLKQAFSVDTSETSVRRAIERHGLEKVATPQASEPGLEIDGDNATVTSDKTTEQLGDTETLIRERGLDPDDWIVERVKINEWDSVTGEKLKQLTIHLRRRIALHFIMPAVHVPDVILTPRGVSDGSQREEQLVVIVGDEQEPYSDDTLKQLFTDWLKYNKPDRGVHLGDLMDFPTISRHKDNPEWSASVQDCLNAGYSTLRTYVEASPSTAWELMVGNHDERIRNELLLRAERMYGIRPADINGKEQEEALSLKRLLHLDALGIKFVDPEGAYAHATIKLSDQLGVRHGWLTGNNAALSSLGRLGHSIIVGHTHHQRVHYKTVYDIDGGRRLLQGVEVGTMCNPHKGIGYAVDPDWQQGFATATMWPDGSFNIELATYNNGVLRWRNQKFQQ